MRKFIEYVVIPGILGAAGALMLLFVLNLIACAPQKLDKGDPGQSGSQGSQGAQGEAGATGPSGANGQDADIEVIVPCPALVAQYPEVLWKMSGKLYGVYASGQKIHLVLLTPGNYQTTDGRGCLFSVDSNGNVN